MTFFFCTLEEYHLGRLDFPFINGINEGALLASLVLIFTGFADENFWVTSIKIQGYYLKYNQLIAYIFFIISFGFTLFRYGNIKKIFEILEIYSKYFIFLK